MNYAEDPAMVRVDFFKPSGKWYTTIAMKFGPFDQGQTRDAFIMSLRKALQIDPELVHPLNAKHNGALYRLGEFTAVCLEPYHKNAHPQMLTAPWAEHRTSDEE